VGKRDKENPSRGTKSLNDKVDYYLKEIRKKEESKELKKEANLPPKRPPNREPHMRGIN